MNIEGLIATILILWSWIGLFVYIGTGMDFKFEIKNKYKKILFISLFGLIIWIVCIIAFIILYLNKKIKIFNINRKFGKIKEWFLK